MLHDCPLSIIFFMAGYRSLLHDLEAQVAIVTDNLELKKAFHSVRLLYRVVVGWCSICTPLPCMWYM